MKLNLQLSITTWTPQFALESCQRNLAISWKPRLRRFWSATCNTAVLWFVRVRFSTRTHFFCFCGCNTSKLWWVLLNILVGSQISCPSSGQLGSSNVFNFGATSSGTKNQGLPGVAGSVWNIHSFSFTSLSESLSLWFFGFLAFGPRPWHMKHPFMRRSCGHKTHSLAGSLVQLCTCILFICSVWV